MVHNIFVGLKFTQVKNLNIENTVRVELNSQYRIGNPTIGSIYIVDNTGVTQQESSLRYIGVVSKIDYTISLIPNKLAMTRSLRYGRRNKSALRPAKIKRRDGILYGRDFQYAGSHPDSEIDYRLTDNTDLRFGCRLFRFGLTDAFEYRYRDFQDDLNDNHAKTVAVAVSNRSQYAGYNLVVNFGFKISPSSTSVRSINRNQDRKHNCSSLSMQDSKIPCSGKSSSL